MRRHQAEAVQPQQHHVDTMERWQTIGIHAVAAASLYVRHGENKRPAPRYLPISRDERDFSTD